MQIRLDGKYITFDGKYRVKRVLAVDCGCIGWPVVVELEAVDPSRNSVLNAQIQQYRADGTCDYPNLNLVEEKRKYRGISCSTNINVPPADVWWSR